MRKAHPGACAVCKRPLDGLRAYEVVTTPCNVARYRSQWKAGAVANDPENFRTEGYLCSACMRQFRELME